MVLAFQDFQMVTFLKRIESRGRVEGEIGDLSVKMERDFRRVVSMNARESLGMEREGAESGGSKEGEGREVLDEEVGRKIFSGKGRRSIRG